MTQTRLGALKTVAKVKATRGEDFYKRIGAIGGKKSRGGGFSSNSERARQAGLKGSRNRWIKESLRALARAERLL